MKTKETGRSMVEMLGVLSIMGVLSVTGILGYALAVRKYRADEIAQAISILAAAMQTTNKDISTGASFEDLVTDTELPRGVDTLEARNQHEIELVTDEGSDLCTEVARLFGDDRKKTIYVDVEDCVDEETLILHVK